MIISDLRHFEFVAEAHSIIGGEEPNNLPSISVLSTNISESLKGIKLAVSDALKVSVSTDTSQQGSSSANSLAVTVNGVVEGVNVTASVNSSNAVS